MFSLVARVTFLPQFGYAFLRLFPRIFPDGSGVILPWVAKRGSHGLERICATLHSLREVLDCVAKQRISELGRMWQALCEVPELRCEATQPGTRADLRDLPFFVGGS